GLQFSRVQFTPDLIPADITGTSILTPDSQIAFQPGPVFANLVLGDEINRAPPKTQSALLEAMEERQVTADGRTRPLPQPFIVIGTQNPIEQEGTYPLPEAQLDRFLIRTSIGYPGGANEVDLVLRRATRQTDRQPLRAVLSAEQLIALQKRVEEVHISRPVAKYVVDIVEATRSSPLTEVGASPRGSLALLKAGRAAAAISGRSHVLPDDIKSIAVPALAHRLILQPDQWIRGVKNEQVVQQILDSVPAPVFTEPGDAQGAGIEQQPVQQSYASPQDLGGANPVAQQPVAWPTNTTASQQAPNQPPSNPGFTHPNQPPTPQTPPSY
ncbi:UNVERIFIED_CONTAM: hypothetical protein GTU68_007899, partial [Idotea baltica]|nr:hypothetical protein [Idotea baltica]